MSLAFDENGRPFIILREQEKKKRVKGLEAHKVRNQIFLTVTSSGDIDRCDLMEVLTLFKSIHCWSQNNSRNILPQFDFLCFLD